MLKLLSFDIDYKIKEYAKEVTQSTRILPLLENIFLTQFLLLNQCNGTDEDFFNLLRLKISDKLSQYFFFSV